MRGGDSQINPHLHFPYTSERSLTVHNQLHPLSRARAAGYPYASTAAGCLTFQSYLVRLSVGLTKEVRYEVSGSRFLPR